MQPKVSVIVPVYNTAPYLKRCLDSLMAQTLHEIEIILIDDGSTDSSGELCDAYANTDRRFRVVHQRNAGVSEARNAGIQLARAPFLMFVDSDDWVEKDYCLVPYTLAQAHHDDLVIFNALNNLGKKRYAFSPDMTDRRVSGEEAVLHMNQFGHAVWNKCFRASLFSQFRFPSGRCYEDIGSTHRLVHQSNIIYLTDTVLYHYCPRESSITRERSRKAATDYFEMYSLYSADLQQWGYPEAARRAMTVGALKYLMVMGKGEPYSVQSHALLKAAPISFRFKSPKRTFLFRFYRFCPVLFDMICILFKKRIH